MSSNQSSPNDSGTRLLAYLRQLETNRGAMADLRCALSPAKIARAWPLLARVGGIGNPRVETVAGLFAYHPQVTNSGNLGTTCRLLAVDSNTFDGRFRRLLSCDRDEICERLRPIVLAAKARGDTGELREVVLRSALLERPRQGLLGAGVLGCS